LAADSYQAGATALVSRSDGFGPLPAQADGNSWNTHHAISADGRFSVFVSDADDLGIADRATHVFLRDDQTGAVTLLDRAGPGGPVADDRATEASISADGSHACFITYAGLIPNAGEHHVYVLTIATGAIVLADRSTGGTIGNAYAQNCVLDADGNTVAFDSGATNLVGGVGSGEHVYVRHLDTGTTQIADSYQGSPGDSSAYGPAIDASGTTVAFASAATNLIGPGGDTNGHTDVYVRALGAVQPVLASRATGAAGALGNGDSDEASISADGSLVAFASRASNLADGDADVASDVHVRNLLATTTTLVSRADGAGGAKANDASLSPVIAGDGSAVAFLSQATNLGADPGANGEGGANRLPFLRTLSGAHTTVLGRASGAGGAVSQAGYHGLSLDQHATNVVFQSSSTELDALAGGSYSEVFQRHLAGAFET